ncbi:MAG: hypothetical protein AMXMBFR64_41620 [Myxococcales bacterium]
MNRVAALVALGLLAAPPATADPAWTVGAAITHDNLTVFPLMATGTIDPTDLLTLEEAFLLGVIQVAEIAADPPEQPVLQRNPVRSNRLQEQVQSHGDGARVNAVAVSNTGDKAILLMAGDVILGGKQDRVIGKDTLVPSGAAAMEVGVFCVEHGRWSGQTAIFKASGKLGHSKLRDKAVFAGDQSAVWAEVAETNVKNKAHTATDTYRATLDASTAGADVDATVAAILPPLASEARATGLAVAIDGRVVALEGFANPALFAKVREKLVRSYALEAATSTTPHKGAPGVGAVDAFLAQMAETTGTGEVHSGGAANAFEESDAIQGVRTLSSDKKAVHQYYKAK